MKDYECFDDYFKRMVKDGEFEYSWLILFLMIFPPISIVVNFMIFFNYFTERKRYDSQIAEEASR